MFYFDTPNYSVAINAKVGSSSLALAIIRKFYRALEWEVRARTLPDGQVASQDDQWHRRVPQKIAADKPVVLLVREPVARFISACYQINLQVTDIQAALFSLINDTPIQRSPPPGTPQQEWFRRQAVQYSHGAAMAAQREKFRAEGKIVPPHLQCGLLRDDPHFFHQSRYLSGPTHCFKFPDHLDAAAELIGVSVPLPLKNETTDDKFTLTPEQIAAVRAYYAEDQALFDAIVVPGYVHETATA
jgi:hypothetical protein